MTSNTFEYHKQKVIQALRYHFISRKEIKVMMVLVNVFAILSAGLFFFKKISPLAFFTQLNALVCDDDSFLDDTSPDYLQEVFYFSGQVQGHIGQ
jgi:hypothetical protein